MRSLGILSVRENNGERNCRRVKISEKERFDRGIPVVVAEISVTGAELQTMSSWRKNRILKRGRKLFRGLGIDVMVMTKACSEAFGVLCPGGMMVETGIKPEEMPKAMEYATKFYQESPVGKAGWVLNRNCNPVCLPILGAMSRRVQFLGIATEQRRQAEEWEEILCEEYGVNLEILEPDALWEQEISILVDVDGGRIVFGMEPILTGKKMSLDLKGYHIDLENLLKEHPELWKRLSFQGWCLRKSG